MVASMLPKRILPEERIQMFSLTKGHIRDTYLVFYLLSLFQCPLGILPGWDYLDGGVNGKEIDDQGIAVFRGNVYVVVPVVFDN
ncbi:hypothetical protein SAMN04488057_12617 [Cyclobacterium lianum]|uniref:Uncharacterized protein n=1 Tax=Cyclobacterium lianum TaxID=388280 RepID=A0A1M7QUG0_9BACT|nr:hypothetical protein SAMN04488057_12617 [Cyclobacterium lianum]